MAVNENFPGFSLDGAGKMKPKSFALHPLHEAAMRLADLGLSRSRSRNKTKDLIGILLCHGARGCADVLSARLGEATVGRPEMPARWDGPLSLPT